ncbi:MAG TPA: mechanosensitive ion channel family protein [Polyangiaceae bacterium]|nr:mechanosensitive ion channel family protein [Polyangiaceae bacterium]
MPSVTEKIPTIERLVDILLSEGTVFLGRAAIVLVVFTVAWLLANWVQRGIVRAFGDTHVDATLSRFLASAARYGLLVVALVSCLSAFGITATSFAAVLGAAGIAVGLAFQGTLSNFAAGLMLLIFRPFRVGDTIKAGNYSGTVKALELFSTVLVTGDNRRVVLPNSTLSNQPLENVTYYPQRRAEILLPFSRRVNVERALSRLIEEARALPDVQQEPAPDAKIQDFRDRSVNVLFGAWCDTEKQPSVVAALALVGKRVMDEAHALARSDAGAQALTAKSSRGDAQQK